jgi:hypothetical protein
MLQLSKVTGPAKSRTPHRCRQQAFSSCSRGKVQCSALPGNSQNHASMLAAGLAATLLLTPGTPKFTQFARIAAASTAARSKMQSTLQ